MFTSCECFPGALFPAFSRKESVLRSTRKTDQPSNPTLSYTQRLERRILELEQQLAGTQKQGLQAQPTAPTSAPFGRPSDALDDGLTGSLTGLKLDEKGVVTYDGTTSFFQLPSKKERGATPSSSSQSPPALGDADLDRRERLVSNAWQQRALEDLSATPVSSHPPCPDQIIGTALTKYPRSHSSTFSTSIGAGSSLSSTSSTGRHSPVSLQTSL